MRGRRRPTCGRRRRARTFVNHEVHYFGSDEAMRTFEDEPWRDAGWVTGPVSRRRFVPAVGSPVRTQDGRLFYFESVGTARKFDADPARLKTLEPMMGRRQSRGRSGFLLSARPPPPGLGKLTG